MFKSARYKLTAWYVLIIMTISIGFSVVIFDLVSIEVQRLAVAQRFRIERLYLQDDIVLPPPQSDIDLVNEARHRLVLILLGINGGILVISAGLAYVLAGKTLKPISDMVDEQNQFISDASHELRTPLTSMKSAMEVSLRDKELGIKEAREIITDNIDDVNKLQALSDHLLQLAQYQKPEILQSRMDKVEVKEIVAGAIKKVTPIAKKKRITIDSEGLEEGRIRANKYNINDLLVILLDNAIKYSPKGKTVKVSARRDDGSMVFKVTDQGMGIAEKDLPHIFERFYRADTARSKAEVGGYGLGLSIAKKIVDLHRGSIVADRIKPHRNQCNDRRDRFEDLDPGSQTRHLHRWD